MTLEYWEMRFLMALGTLLDVSLQPVMDKQTAMMMKEKMRFIVVVFEATKIKKSNDIAVGPQKTRQLFH